MAESTTPPEPDDADESAADEPEVPLNRAARRAQGKKPAKPATWPGQRLHGRGTVQAPRQYGTRRSG